jgi:hypothetical protein
MELFNLSTLVADRRAGRERDAQRERLWRRRRRENEAQPVPASKQAPVARTVSRTDP